MAQRRIRILEQSFSVIIAFDELISHRFKERYWIDLPKDEFNTTTLITDWMEHKDINHPLLTISEDD